MAIKENEPGQNCGFYFKITKWSDPNSQWPEYFSSDCLDNLNEAKRTPYWSSYSKTVNGVTTVYGSIAYNDAYVKMSDAYKSSSGKYDFYIHAISDISTQFYKTSVKYSLWVYNTCYDNPIVYQMSYPNN